MLPAKPLGPRSSLLSHSFPSFYACYLLKSIRTPQSTTVYIGSTPSPPRRIRQHNGELTQGARKTRSKRPWVMQMIVHGFPSRLAALQFEWAWQHPHKSRHLRDANGSIFGTRASKLLKKNVAIVRTMISKHPFNTWPLHVKLFTEEAVVHWTAFVNVEPPLPPGFTCSVELEGVDGNSGHHGSGRQGPIAIDDDDFTHALLAKNNALVASGSRLNCSICHESIENYSSDHLATALCPSSGCAAISHLTCLSQDFIKESSGTTEIIPRGGFCKSCHNYILWGDVVRGCYRRLLPGDGNEYPDVATDNMFISDEGDKRMGSLFSKKKKKLSVRSSSMSPLKSPSNSRRKGTEQASASQSSEGELFDFVNIVSSSDGEETPIKRKPGRPRKHTSSPHHPSPISKGQILPQSPNIMQRKPKKKDAAETPKLFVRDSVDVVNISSSSEGDGILFTDVLRTPSKGKGKEKRVAFSSSEEEIFDLDNISSSLEGGSTKRRPGRPRKSDLKNPNTATPLSSRKEGYDSIKSSVRKLDARSPKTSSIEYTGSGNTQCQGAGKLGLPYLAAPPAVLRIGSPKSAVPSLSSKPPILHELQVSKRNQRTVQRRPGRPLKDPFVRTWTSVNKSHYPPNLPELTSKGTVYEFDPHSPDSPKLKEYDLEHLMSNLVLTTPNMTRVLESDNPGNIGEPIEVYELSD